MEAFNPLSDLQPIRVQDDLINYDKQTKYLFKSGPSQISYQSANLNSISNASVSGTIVPPGVACSVDRHAKISLCYRVTLTAAVDEGLGNLFVPNHMALRFLPITQSMSAASIQINSNASTAISPNRFNGFL